MRQAPRGQGTDTWGLMEVSPLCAVAKKRAKSHSNPWNIYFLVVSWERASEEAYFKMEIEGVIQEYDLR